jgi:hypothetical protein
MLAVHAQELLSPKTDRPLMVYASLSYVVWDWMRLGVFTGSRVSEYAQSGFRKNHRFQVFPINEDTGVWAGQPLAFIRVDFKFFDKKQCCVPLSVLHVSHRKGLVSTVHIRFRYDKSSENFLI